jgi:hypothetical protein
VYRSLEVIDKAVRYTRYPAARAATLRGRLRQVGSITLASVN